MTKTIDNARVIAPPPLIYLSGLIIGGLLTWYFPIVFCPKVMGYAVGGILIVAGLAVVFVAKSKMEKAKTNIEPWKPTNAILSDGVYGISRNPIYLALIFIYLGVTLSLNLVWSLPLLILVQFVVHYGVILKEEKYLEKKFGQEYLDYKKRVRRWI